MTFYTQKVNFTVTFSTITQEQGRVLVASVQNHPDLKQLVQHKLFSLLKLSLK